MFRHNFEFDDEDSYHRALKVLSNPASHVRKKALLANLSVHASEVTQTEMALDDTRATYQNAYSSNNR